MTKTVEKLILRLQNWKPIGDIVIATSTIYSTLAEAKFLLNGADVHQLDRDFCPSEKNISYICLTLETQTADEFSSMAASEHKEEKQGDGRRRIVWQYKKLQKRM